MSNLNMRAEPLLGNQKGIKSSDILLISYKRPLIRGNLNEVTKIGTGVKFGSPTIGCFSVVATIGNYAQGGLDWVVSAETVSKVEVIKSHMVNGSLSIVGKDTYHAVILKSFSIIFREGRNIPLRICMSFVAKNFQLADIEFEQSTKSGSSKKGLFLHDKRKT